MYVNRVRDSIKRLTINEYEEYLRKLRFVLRRKYSKNVKPSELQKRVEEFIKGSNSNLESFEAYLLTFDEIAINGGIDSLQGNSLRIPKTWRQLLLKVTEDQTLPPDLIKNLEDESLLIEVKALFQNSINYCTNEKKDQLYSNLRTFNNFLRIKNG